jgi:hypothetical protein
VASYRGTFRLLLKYTTDRIGRQPTELQIGDIDADPAARHCHGWSRRRNLLATVLWIWVLRISSVFTHPQGFEVRRIACEDPAHSKGSRILIQKKLLEVRTVVLEAFDALPNPPCCSAAPE